MVLRNRSYIRAIDPALRRQRLRDRFDGRGAGLQATVATARTSVVGLPAGGRGCCMVRQTSQHRTPTTGRTRRRGNDATGAYRKDRDPRRLLSVAFGFEHLLDLLSQLRL